MRCQRCGHESQDRSLSACCPLCGQPLETTVRGGFQSGAATAGAVDDSPFTFILQAVCLSFMRPRIFFSSLPATVSTGRAIVYALVTGCIASILSIAAETFFPISLGWPFSSGNALASPLWQAARLILTPMALLVGIFFTAVLVQLSLKIMQSRPKPFSVTFRTLCFTQGAALLQWVPFIGPLLSLIAWVYLAIAGLHTVHGISRLRALGGAAAALPAAVPSFYGADRCNGRVFRRRRRTVRVRYPPDAAPVATSRGLPRLAAARPCPRRFRMV